MFRYHEGLWNGMENNVESNTNLTVLKQKTVKIFEGCRRDARMI